MCGIYGYIGNVVNNIEILNKLEKLEYRGYDSAGIAYVDKSNNLVINKHNGRINNLKQCLVSESTKLAISHTRWATHGSVTLNNCHPHISSSGRYVIVHNGVIENIEEIKSLFLKDISLIGDTDTEVVANMFDILDGNILEKFKKLISLLKGSFSILLIDKSNFNKIYFIKNKTPLLVSKLDIGYEITSDITSITKSNGYHILNDCSYGYVSNDTFFVVNDEANFICRDILESVDAKLEYDHYMYKEILEQKQVINNSYDDIFCFYKNKIIQSDEVCIIGAGTSYYAGCYIKIFIEKYLAKKTNVYIASEFAYKDTLMKDNTFCILLSQSGETADVISCVGKIQNMGKLLLTNSSYSTLANMCDYKIDIKALKEVSVASTKSYTTMISIMYKIVSDNYNDGIYSLNKCINEVIDKEEEIKRLVNRCDKYNKIFFIGRKSDYTLSLESALKVKEVTYMQCESYPSGELKHGTLALVDNNTLVICFISEDNTKSICRTNVLESLARGADVYIVSKKDISLDNDDFTIDIKYDIDNLSFVVFSQLFAYYLAVFKGLNVDKPKNLAKSVTVE